MKSDPRQGSYRSGKTAVDGVARDYSYRRSAKYGFTVNVGIATDSALAEWRKQAWIVAALTAAFVLTSLGFSRLVDVAWRRQEQNLAALAAGRELLDEAQRIANLGRYVYDLGNNRWTSSDVRDGIFGIGPDYPRDSAHWLGLVALESRAELQGYLNTVVADRLPFDREYRIVRPRDGAERWVHGKGKLQFDGVGNPVALIGAIQDITERKTAQQALEESEGKYRALFESANDGIFLQDASGFLDCNRKGASLFGLSREQLIGKAPAELSPEPARWTAFVGIGGGTIAGRATRRDSVFRSATAARRRRCHRRRSHAEPHRISRRPVRAGDRPGHRAAQGERARNFSASTCSATRSSNTLPGLFFVFDEDGRFLAWNRSIEEITGRSAEEVAAAHPLDFFADEEKPLVAQAIQSAFTQGRATVEACVLAKDGTAVPYFFSGIGADLDGRPGVIGVGIDIAERKRAEDSLRKGEEKFRKAFDVNPGAANINRISDGMYVSINPGFTRIMGYTADEVIGRTSLELNIWENPEDRARMVEELSRQGVVSELEARFRDKDGRLHDGLMSAAVIDIEGVPHVITITQDATERKQAEEKLHLAASVFTYAREGIMITAADATIIDVNDAFTRITGYRREEVLGMTPRILNSGRQKAAFYAAMWRELNAEGYWQGEIWNRRRNGEIYAEMQTISAVRDAHGKTVHYVALFSDITQIKEHEKQLEHIAHYDTLTTLPNRVLLADRLHQAMAQAVRRGQRLTVVYLDLDGFKAINDRHGHDAGDQMLIGLAARMKHTLREGDTLARLGGDEFVAVLLDLPDVEASVPMLTRLLAAAAEPVQFGDLTLQVSASLGVTFYPQGDEVDADQLLRQADQAMYQAKLVGKNRYHVFDAELDRSVRGYHEDLERIRRALTEREFVLHYQPKVNMRTGTVIGAEALIRWQHPERGLLLPAAFLPVIEDHALAVEIGKWVIDTALTQMEHWRMAGLNVPVSVNVGARQLQQADFANSLREILALHPDVEPGELELEVLETSALEDLAGVSEVIEACREIGVMFALDDFGTGYSSLTYLKQLPVTQLKIDQSFVRDMLDDPDDLAILEGIIGMATAFRREIVAEGVETVAHGEMLLRLGCEKAQGYGIARPMPGHEMPAWSSAWQPDPSWAGLGPVGRDDLPLLIAGVEHRAWIASVEDRLKGDRDAPPPLHRRQCRFGIWLENEGQARHGTHPAFQGVDELHRQVHALAAEMLAIQAQGRGMEALARMGELWGLRDALLEQLGMLAREARG